MTNPRITAIKTAEWTPETLKTVSDRFEGRAPEEILRWGFETFSPYIALATGFGAEGVVLMHMTSQIAPDATVFYLDTDLLFKEIYKLRDLLAERLGTRFTRVHSGVSLDAQAEANGPRCGPWTPTCAARSARSSRCASSFPHRMPGSPRSGGTRPKPARTRALSNGTGPTGWSN